MEERVLHSQLVVARDLVPGDLAQGIPEAEGMVSVNGITDMSRQVIVHYVAVEGRNRGLKRSAIISGDQTITRFRL